MKLLIFLLSFSCLILSIFGHNVENDKDKNNNEETVEFDKQKMFEKCGKVLRGNTLFDPKLVCYRTSTHLIIRNVEVLSHAPFVIQYHNMVHRRLCKRAVREAEELQLEQLKISGTANPELSKVRAANGTWLNHHKKPNFSRLHQNLQNSLQGALDLRASEPWQILSYNSNGYYAPHYDYLNPKTQKVRLEEDGNRIATVLVILQIAKKGGTTVFPRLDLNIRPKAGDVIVWINFETSGGADKRTLHAACPIIEGTKIGATLWVRSKWQELSLPCSLDSSEFLVDQFL